MRGRKSESERGERGEIEGECERERGRVRETVHQVVHGWQQVPVRKGSEFFFVPVSENDRQTDQFKSTNQKTKKWNDSKKC